MSYPVFHSDPQAILYLREKISQSLKLFAPPPELSLSEWANSNFILSREDSSEFGKYSTDRAPYQKPILDAISNPLNKEIIFVAGSQLGKTQIVKITIAYYVVYDPSPMLMIQPTKEMAESFSKDRLAPMIRDNDSLKSKIHEAKGRSSGNTIDHKVFPGGHITLVGSNSPAGLASRPIRIVMFDEIDRYAPSAGTEGDPVSLAIARTRNFDNKKIIKISSPGTAGLSRIWVDWEETDQQYFYVPCPICKEFQVLKWENIKFPDKNPANTFYECPYCRSQLVESDKHKILQLGEMRATFPERIHKPGFHVSELYSPWSTWSEMAERFLTAQKQSQAGNIELMKTFINTSLAELWEAADTAQIDDSKLLLRVEDYCTESEPILPEKVLVLTAGVDVQDNRIELKLKGYGLDEESWMIDYKIWYGNPARGELWKELDDYLLQSWEHESGIKLSISSVCIDTGGHHTDEVYKFVKKRSTRRIFAIKGSNYSGQPIIGRPSRQKRYNMNVFMIGTDTAKEKIYARLQIEEPGPGYMHFNQKCDQEYFKQLTAEKLVKKYSRGKYIFSWEKIKGRRNEALDCEVYALAALNLLNVNWTILKKNMEQQFSEAKKVKEEREQSNNTLPQTPQPVKKLPQPVIRRKNFANSWGW